MLPARRDIQLNSFIIFIFCSYNPCCQHVPAINLHPLSPWQCGPDMALSGFAPFCPFVIIAQNMPWTQCLLKNISQFFCLSGKKNRRWVQTLSHAPPSCATSFSASPASGSCSASLMSSFVFLMSILLLLSLMHVMRALTHGLSSCLSL